MVKISFGNPNQLGGNQDSYHNNQGQHVYKGQASHSESISTMGISNSSKSKKVRPRDQTRHDRIIAYTLTWESLSDISCRTLSQDTHKDHNLKMILKHVEVDKAVQTPFFNIQEFDPILKVLVVCYDGHKHKSTIPYNGHDVTMSFWSAKFTRIFRIPSQGAKVAKLRGKRTTQQDDLLKRECHDKLMQKEWEGV